MSELALQLSDELHRYGDELTAQRMRNHLKTDKFFYGVEPKTRKKLLSTTLQYFPIKTYDEYKYVFNEIWRGFSREEQYAAVDFAIMFPRWFEEKESFRIFENILKSCTYWDTADLIASELLGRLLKNKPRSLQNFVDRWIHDDNHWMRRATLMIHHNRGKDTDSRLLKQTIERLTFDKEYYIRQAIGWILSEYARTNENWVIEFIRTHPKLSNLSKRSAMRHLSSGNLYIHN
jgi:3-methyladenine DNA glycosylase AlkD